MITRCTACGSYFDLRRFPACPVCGRPDIPMASPRPQFQISRQHAEMEANRDSEITAWAIPAGIILGIAGPLALLKVAAGLTPGIIAGLVLMLAVLAIFGANARSKDSPNLFAAGRVARTALLTMAIAVAIVAVIGVAIAVLIFVACASGGGPKW